MAVICRGLAANTTITTVGLGGCKLGVLGMKMVVDVVVLPSCSWTSLNVGFNHLGAEGGVLVAKAIAKNRSLTHLNVR